MGSETSKLDEIPHEQQQDSHGIQVSASQIDSPTHIAEWLKRGVSHYHLVDEISSEQKNKLMLAALECGKLEHAVRLLKLGANPSAREDTEWGDAPVHIAARIGNLDMLILLVDEYHVDVNCLNRAGFSPLHWAAQKGHFLIARCLILKYKAEVNIKNSHGSTPLHVAAAHDQIEIMRLLLKDANANPNSKNDNGNTPLHCGATKGHLVAVQVLVEESAADDNAKNDAGMTALDQAKEEGFTVVADYLKEFVN